MGLRRDAAAAAAVAGTELRRSVRAVRRDRRQLAAFGLAALGVVPVLLLSVPALYVAGAAVAAGELSVPRSTVRGQFVTALAGLVSLGALRGLERSSTVEHADFLLTAASPRALAVGLFAAEYLRTLAVVVPGFLAFYGAFLLGAGAPAALAIALVVALPTLSAPLAVGHLVGVASRALARAIALPERIGRVVGVLAGGGLVAGAVLGAPALVEFVRAPPERFAALPVAPYADLLFVGTPVAVDPGIDAAAAVALVVATPPVALAASVPLSRRLWLGDGPERPAGDDRNRTVAVPSPLAGSALGRSVFRLWLRGLRAPTRFVHLLYAFFVAVPVLGSVTGAARPLLWAPPLAAALGALLAGATFGLNPLGDEGDALPTVVLSPLPAATLVRARMLAGLAPWLPLSLAVVCLAGAAGPMGPATTARLAVLAVALSAYSAAVAVGLGTLVPRFETVRTFGVETASPTAWALFGHGFAVAVAAGVGFAAVALPGHVLGMESLAARVLPLAAVCAVLAVPAFAGYRYAVRRLARFTYE